MPCGFIRLTGCNLRCSYCDTAYAREGGEARTVEELVRWARGCRTELVQVTGGEPLLQPGAKALTRELLRAGLRVSLETNGSLSLEDLPPGVMVVMDIKTPGSGEDGSTDLGNLEHLRPEDNIKFVISSRQDYLWAMDMVQSRALDGVCAILFSPAHGTLRAATLAEWIVEDRAPVRFQLQLHKVLWPDRERGV